MKKYIFTFVISIILISCKEKVRYEVIEVPSMPVIDIFSADSVIKFTEKHRDNETISNNYIENAKKLEKENPKKAIHFVKRAITIFPKREHYEYLGGLCLNNKQFEEAYDAYYFLTIKRYTPFGDMYIYGTPSKENVINYFLACVLANKYFSSYNVNAFVADLGVPAMELKSAMLKSKLLGTDPDSWLNKNIEYIFVPEENAHEYLSSSENFNNILASITDESQVFDISEEDVCAISKNPNDYSDEMDMGEEDLSYSYNMPNVHGKEFFTYEYQTREDKSRSVYLNSEFKKKLVFGENCVGLVYNVDNSMVGCPKNMREIYHTLILFDKDANYKDANKVAWQNGESLGLLSFDKTTYKLTEYKRNWEKPYNKDDLDNHYIGKEITSNRLFTIDVNNCKIVEHEVEEEPVTTTSEGDI